MKTKEINDSNYKDFIDNKNNVFVIKFGANWCGPCRTMNPIIDELKEEHENLDIYSVDVDTSPEVSSFFKVRNIPYVVFFKNGEIQGTSIGIVSKNTLKEKIESLLQ